MASLKGILGGIGKVAGGLISGGLGGLAGDAVEILKGQFPGKMSEQEQKQFELAMQDAAHKRELETLKAWNEQEAEFNNRIAEMEGTAGDLLQAGWIGRVVLFLRGLQRPLWGFLVLFMGADSVLRSRSLLCCVRIVKAFILSISDVFILIPKRFPSLGLDVSA